MAIGSDSVRLRQTDAPVSSANAQTIENETILFFVFILSRSP